ncbi:interferon a3-like [Polypterus senegalus]|uniref:interferon a3-like n=1 Tax=Polypterus senegalus TaxID=55291 RepID=UPI001966683B|nr:interferon a3-like [Polypterus senegalus]
METQTAAWERTDGEDKWRTPIGLQELTSTMHISKFLLALCATLLCLTSSSSACRWIQQRYLTVSRDSLDWLSSMGKLQVHKQRIPDDIYKTQLQVEGRIELMSLVIHHIIILFQNASEAQATKHFLSDLHRQEKELSQCVTGKTDLLPTGLRTKVTLHFKKLQSLLKRKNHSSRHRGWKFVRTQVYSHLQRLDLYGAQIKKELDS